MLMLELDLWVSAQQQKAICENIVTIRYKKKIDILNDVLLREIIFKNDENYVLPPSHLRIYCRCY